MSSQNYIEEIKEVWHMVMESFKAKLSETTANLWFGDLEILSFADSSGESATEYTITMGISSEFKFNIIQKKYLEDIRKEFSNFLGFDVTIHLIFTGSSSSGDKIDSQPTTTSTTEEITQSIEKKTDDPGTEKEFLDYKFEYTFENFIVGSTNKFAQAACVAVATHPAENYNPLFIYGNSGLGKTHLMYATINRMKQNNPNVRIIYTKGEDFTNQLIGCLVNNKTMEEFRDKYRKCDVLLIDDIQFIAGKTATQEEFFHTFNALHEEKKQIILTSDRPPREIRPLEERLVTRFEWGLIADIEPPDLELRIAIIKKKAEQVNVSLPDDVSTFLGENLRSNIRQIEGAIKKLGALSYLSGKDITMDLARECISELLGGAEPISVTVEKIFAAVSKKYGIPKNTIIGKSRSKETANARHISIYLIRQITEMSFPNIAKIFDKDHSTMISSFNLIAAKIFSDPLFSSEINDLKKEISGC